MSAWDTKLLDCFSDIKVLLVSCFCGLCQLAQQKATVESHNCGIGDFIPVCLCGICCAVSVRGKIREKYGIEGSVLTDLLAAWCCGLCALSQQTRQLRLKGDKPGGCFMEN